MANAFAIGDTVIQVSVGFVWTLLIGAWVYAWIRGRR